MKIRRLSYPLFLALTASMAVACGGQDVQTETPASTEPPPAPAPVTPSPADPTTTPAAGATTDAAAAPKKEEAPPQKTLREKLVGTWALDFSGETRTTAETEAKKKAGKDEKKLADLLKKAEETAAKQKFENTADTIAAWEGDKAVSKAKYEVVKEEGNTITIKQTGKDEVSKKDAPATEIAITFKDDNTIELKDPKEKDQKKAKTLVYKKGAATGTTAAATPATPATPAAGDKGATAATAATPAKPAADKPKGATK